MLVKKNIWPQTRWQFAQLLHVLKDSLSADISRRLRFFIYKATWAGEFWKLVFQKGSPTPSRRGTCWAVTLQNGDCHAWGTVPFALLLYGLALNLEYRLNEILFYNLNDMSLTYSRINWSYVTTGHCSKSFTIWCIDYEWWTVILFHLLLRIF